jgi:pimeloyl-ACP methyl ester carboxylesterase
VIKHFHLESAALLGHSWGAVLALEHALRHPERVSHIILDTSESACWNTPSKRSASHRVLFGSDFSINDPGEVITRVQNAFLTEEQKQAVLSGNLETLLRKVSARASAPF